MKLDWPWEGDLSVVARPGHKASKGASIDLASAAGVTLAVPEGIVARTFKITGKSAQAIYTSGGEPVIAIWQHPEFKGAVVRLQMCRLMLLYDSRLTQACLVHLARLLSEEGIIAAAEIDALVAKEAERLAVRFGKRVM